MLEGVWGRSEDKEAESGAAARSERAAYGRHVTRRLGSLKSHSRASGKTGQPESRRFRREAYRRHTEAASTAFGRAGACSVGYVHR